MLVVLMLIGLNLNAPWQTIELEVMGRINYARRHGFDCVSRSYRAVAVAPLVPHLKLRSAARGHAADMQARGYFAHESPDGVGIKVRVANAGYLASRVGENILGGQRLGSSARSAVKWWLESPVHCRNIMNSAYTQFAAGHIFVPSDPAGIQHYWVLDFATPALGQSLGSK